MIETIVLFIVSALLLYLWIKRRPNNFPPGPTPLPIIGNIHQMPRGHFWIAMDKWSKKYGPIIGLSAFDTLIVAITEIDHIVAALRKEEFQARPNNVVIRERMFGKLLDYQTNSRDTAEEKSGKVKRPVNDPRYSRLPKEVNKLPNSSQHL
ncbi:hypothetical protein J6590_005553 [Homalodisca vitripennis]|nr:hypothetical protein J6590_005553 [Homalodisca vitripennis]